MTEKVCIDFIEALRAQSGNEIANASKIYYIKGFYYIKIAHRFPDDSVGIIPDMFLKGVREKEVIRRTVEMLDRVNRRQLKEEEE